MIQKSFILGLFHRLGSVSFTQWLTLIWSLSLTIAVIYLWWSLHSIEFDFLNLASTVKKNCLSSPPPPPTTRSVGTSTSPTISTSMDCTSTSCPMVNIFSTSKTSSPASPAVDIIEHQQHHIDYDDDDDYDVPLPGA